MKEWKERVAVRLHRLWIDWLQAVLARVGHAILPEPTSQLSSVLSYFSSLADQDYQKERHVKLKEMGIIEI